jgi:hypothetical protein
MSAHYRGDAFSIVRAVSGSRGLALQRPVIVFQCYLDDSKSGKVVAMGGFIAASEHWEALEPQFDEILNRYEVPIFHALRFHKSDGVFDGWSKIKKRSLVEELFSAAHGRMKGFCLAARKQGFESEKRETGRVASMSAYGVCFSALLIRSLMDPDIGPIARKSGVAFLVETGNPNNAEIERFFNQFSQRPEFEGALRSLTFIPKGHCRAIQIADFFAFYGRRHLQRHDRFDGKFVLPIEPYLAIMQDHVPTWEWMATSFLKNPVGHLGTRIKTLDDLNALDGPKQSS